MVSHVWQSLVLVLLLVACTNPQLPFSKNLPSVGESQPSVNPPWDALVQAAPGAENELDLETLNGPQQAAVTPPPDAEPQALPEIAIAPAVAAKPKPPPAKDAVTIRYVAVPMVKGASGSGNAELTGAMRQVLADAGWPVLEKPQADAILIRQFDVGNHDRSGSALQRGKRLPRRPHRANAVSFRLQQRHQQLLNPYLVVDD